MRKPPLAFGQSAADVSNGAKDKTKKGAYVPSSPKSEFARPQIVHTHLLQVVVQSEMIFNINFGTVGAVSTNPKI